LEAVLLLMLLLLLLHGPTFARRLHHELNLLSVYMKCRYLDLFFSNYSLATRMSTRRWSLDRVQTHAGHSIA